MNAILRRKIDSTECTWCGASFRGYEPGQACTTCASFVPGTRFVHFTDAESAGAIKASGRLWASSYTTSVYACSEGGNYVAAVVATPSKHGRAKSREVAVVFTTAQLPWAADPEEIRWEPDADGGITISVKEILVAAEAIKLMDGSSVHWKSLHGVARDPKFWGKAPTA